jgi:predicted lipid-binding transport protein (Tim44 family)
VFEVAATGVVSTETVIAGFILAAAGASVAYAATLRWPRLWSARRRMIRSRRVELAAEEAVFDSPAFDPATVKAAAAELHAAVIAAWSADDRRRLRDLLSPELFGEWSRRLDDLRRRRYTNPLRRRGRLRLRYVGLVNRTGDDEDQVVVHVRARMDDAIYDHRGRIVFRDTDDSGRHTHSEYWTLGRRDGRWVLVSVETEQEGAHHLTAPIVPSPWADDRLHDFATLERATTITVPPASLAEIVPLEFTGDLRLAALDLAGFDGRYDPDVLEAAARRTVAAWAEAIDGNHGPLIALAGRQTVEALLYPTSRRHRLVIRGPRLQRLRIVSLRPRARPPMMTVEATISARCYLEDRHTGAITGGSRNRDSTFTVFWQLHLNNDAKTPWRIASIARPAPRRGSVLYRFTIGLACEILRVLFPGRRSFL